MARYSLVRFAASDRGLGESDIQRNSLPERFGGGCASESKN